MKYSVAYYELLEKCVLDELIPVYNKYFLEKDLDPPQLSLDVSKVLQPKIAALLKPQQGF